MTEVKDPVKTTTTNWERYSQRPPCQCTEAKSLCPNDEPCIVHPNEDRTSIGKFRFVRDCYPAIRNLTFNFCANCAARGVDGGWIEFLG